MFNPWVGKIPWRRKWQLTLVFLLGKSHGQKSLLDYSPWGFKESDRTEQPNTHTHLKKRERVRSSPLKVELLFLILMCSSL